MTDGAPVKTRNQRLVALQRMSIQMLARQESPKGTTSTALGNSFLIQIK